MFQRAQRRSKPRPAAIAQPATIALLASAARQELVDTLEALGGTATAAELAAQLGRPVDGLYYHLARLRKGGLIEELAGRSAAGRGERRFRIVAPRGRALALAYRPDDPRNTRAVRTVVASMLRIARRDFDRAIARPDAVVRGPRRELWAARGQGWLTAAEVTRANQLLHELTELLRRPRTDKRDRLLSLCFVVAPVAARPARR
ncbi:MAG: helix-turn-helix domain-containing protein [Deltaproteobacteria bacterium]|nr:helix-turn-helix domain-containing protein [Deltaproteobacteria bacterium]